MKTSNLVTVIKFVYPHDVGIPRSLLESEGIDCFVCDEFTVGVNPFYSNAIGGIRLQVKENDARRATELLTEGGFINEKDLQEKTTEQKPFDGTTCPYCGSLEIVKDKNFSNKISVIASILTILMFCIPVPFFRRNYHCMDCRKNFSKTKK